MLGRFDDEGDFFFSDEDLLMVLLLAKRRLSSMPIETAISALNGANVTAELGANQKEILLEEGNDFFLLSFLRTPHSFDELKEALQLAKNLIFEKPDIIGRLCLSNRGVLGWSWPPEIWFLVGRNLAYDLRCNANGGRRAIAMIPSWRSVGKPLLAF